MNVFVGIVAIIVLIIAYLHFRGRNARGNVRPDELQKNRPKPDTQFHAVSIKYSNTACQAAMDLLDRRFLSGAAPKIPLPGCDALECRCKFAHHKDRRENHDRRNPFGQGFGGGATGQHKIEQRQRNDRRNEESD